MQHRPRGANLPAQHAALFILCAACCTGSFAEAAVKADSTHDACSVDGGCAILEADSRDWSAAYAPPPGGSAGRITDLSYTIRPGALVFESADGLPEDIAALFERRDKCVIMHSTAIANAFTLGAGTHLDAPSHFSDGAFEDGRGVESLSLETLNGPALLVEVPDATNITAAALEALAIPAGVSRLLFKTLNTKRQLMRKRGFVCDYTSFDEGGAAWLVARRPDVRLVGIDYLTVATYDDLKAPHEHLLGAGVIAVEGLNLVELNPGLHQLHCLPVKLHGSDGAPVRCITIG